MPPEHDRKAAAGVTKTRLVIDPDRALAVAQIFAWRTQDKVGRKTIVAQLAADAAVPPPGRRHMDGLGGQQDPVQPQVHRAHGLRRNRKINGKMTVVSADQWLWSPEPTHPAIITRQMFQDAQKVVPSTASPATAPASAPNPGRGGSTRCAAGSATAPATGACTASPAPHRGTTPTARTSC